MFNSWFLGKLMCTGRSLLVIDLIPLESTSGYTDYTEGEPSEVFFRFSGLPTCSLRDSNHKECLAKYSEARCLSADQCCNCLSDNLLLQCLSVWLVGRTCFLRKGRETCVGGGIGSGKGEGDFSSGSLFSFPLGGDRDLTSFTNSDNSNSICPIEVNSVERILSSVRKLSSACPCFCGM